MNAQLQTLEHAQQTAIDPGFQFDPKRVVTLPIMATGFYVGRWACRMPGSMRLKLGLDETLRQLPIRIVRTLVLGLFLVMALQNLGAQLLPSLVGLGVAAGLTIIFTRPFKVGEYISIVDVEGTVEEIKHFNTVPSHPDRSQSVIPNRKVVGEILHNFGTLRRSIPFPQHEVRLTGSSV